MVLSWALIDYAVLFINKHIEPRQFFLLSNMDPIIFSAIITAPMKME